MKSDNTSQSSIDNAVELANEIVGRIVKEKQHLPYRMNIIDELHANENAHTRILLQLLRYKANGKYPILSSFLEMANGLMDFFRAFDRYKTIEIQLTKRGGMHS